MTLEDEDTLIRSVAWANADAIRAAKLRAEEQLKRANADLEQRSAELARSLALTRATLDATPSGILAANETGRVTATNAAFLAMWGLGAADAAGDVAPVHRAIAAALADPSGYLARVDAVATAGGTDDFDVLELTDGRVVERYARVQTVAGLYAGRVWVFRDVTERVRAESDLRLRDRAIRALDQGVLIGDATRPDRVIEYASPGFTRLTGYAVEEVVGRNCRFLQGPDTDPNAVARLRAALDDGTACTVELLNYRKDGTAFWNQVSVSPVHDDDGRLTHFVGVQMDVTARRTLEEQYRQSQKMEAIGQLAGGVAHDFNNMLTVINGYSELLADTLPAGAPDRQLVEEIRKAGERSAALTRQLLAFSRRQVLAPRILELNRVVAEAESLLRRLIGEDVRLLTRFAAGVGTVRADQGQLEQVLLNLAVNARDAMPTGGELLIETGQADVPAAPAAAPVPPGAYATLTVTDTGCGMSAETKAHIFEPFFTTKGPGKGTGLGLATVFGIVQEVGGAIEVESEEGSGTTFRIYLPITLDADPKRVAAAGPRTAAGGSETVLVVEDEDSVRSLTRHILTASGYTVLDAADGETAAVIADRHGDEIRLLVTDVVMPGPGGRSVAEQLRRRFPALKVLFVSGYTDDAIVRHGVSQDEVHFLPKPFSPASLAAKVRKVLDE